MSDSSSSGGDESPIPDEVAARFGKAYSVDEYGLIDSALDAALGRADVPSEALDVSALRETLRAERDELRVSYFSQLSEAQRAADAVSDALLDLLAKRRWGGIGQIRDVGELIDRIERAERTLRIAEGSSVQTDPQATVDKAAAEMRDIAAALERDTAVASRITGIQTAPPTIRRPAKRRWFRRSQDEAAAQTDVRLDRDDVILGLRRTTLGAVSVLYQLLQTARQQGETELATTSAWLLYHDSVQKLSEQIQSVVLGRVLKEVSDARERGMATEMTLSVLDGLYARAASENLYLVDAYRKVQALLTARPNGGSFGIAGPRGAGKTTLIEYFVTISRSSAGSYSSAPVSLRVSAPVSYDAREFLLLLYARVLQSVTGMAPDEAALAWQWSREAGGYRARLAATRAISLAAVGAGILLLWHSSLNRSSLSSISGISDVSAAVACGITVGLGIAIGFLLRYERAVDLWNRHGSYDPDRADVLGRPYGLRSAYLTSRIYVLAPFAALALSAAVALFLLEAGWHAQTWPLLAGLLVAGVGIAGALVSFPVSAPLPDFRGVDDDLRRQVELQYQLTFTKETSVSASLGPAASAATVARRRATEFSLLPKSYPQIVDEFRDYLQTKLVGQASLVIGIDELDKIADPVKANQFLDDIKAVFDIPGCTFLISVSDDAAANFQRRGVPFRDSFDSAFDDVVLVAPPTVAESEQLLIRRALGWTDPFVEFCHVWSAGRPRDLLRVAREVAETRDDDGLVQLEKCVRAIAVQDFDDRLSAVRRVLLSLDSTTDVMDLLGVIDGIGLIGKEPDAVLKAWRDLYVWPAKFAGGQPASTSARIAMELAASALICQTAVDYFVPQPALPRVELVELVHPGLARAIRLQSGAPNAAIAACQEFRSIVLLPAL